MKLIFLIILSLFSTKSYTSNELLNMYLLNNDFKKIAYHLYKDKKYFSSAIYAKKHLIKAKKINNFFESFIEKLMKKTDINLLSDLPSNVLKKHQSNPTYLTLAKRMIEEGNYEQAYKFLQEMTEKSIFELEIIYLKVALAHITNRYENINELSDLCIVKATKKEEQSNHIKLKRYYQIIQDQCLITKSRIFYERGDYNSQRQTLELIDKRSYLWPYTLIENAWGYYASKKHNESLGKVATYNAPFLKKYKIPESIILESKIYLDLCLHSEIENLIFKYKEKYKNEISEVKKFLRKYKNKSYIDKINISQYPTVAKTLLQTRKRIRYNILINNIKKLKSEIKLIKKSKINKKRYIEKILLSDLDFLKKMKMRIFIKNIESYLINLQTTWNHIAYIELESLKKQRKNRTSKKHFTKEPNNKKQHGRNFWEFNGEFWADELGDYVINLKSEC